MNKVLPSLVPGLSVGLKELNLETLEDGTPGTRVELLSIRSNRALPFRAGSGGIRKIVAILGLLIQAYGNENATVAIDELDSGVFEFLLGEIIEVIRDGAKGQLVFTAHNLRPLECLPASSLVFTTTNPDNQYIKFSGIKKSHNLQDRYLRAINLGGQNEAVYDPTDKVNISTAFFKANHDLTAENKAINEILSRLDS